MALRVCEECTTRFAVGLKTCPQCGSGHHHEESEADVPKISRADGPTYKGYLEPERVEDQAELERESAEATETDEERDERIAREEREAEESATETDEERESGVTEPFRTDGGGLKPPATETEPARPVTRTGVSTQGKRGK